MDITSSHFRIFIGNYTLFYQFVQEKKFRGYDYVPNKKLHYLMPIYQKKKAQMSLHSGKKYLLFWGMIGL